jgi:hypothetical protein
MPAKKDNTKKVAAPEVTEKVVEKSSKNPKPTKAAAAPKEKKAPRVVHPIYDWGLKAPEVVKPAKGADRKNQPRRMYLRVQSRTDYNNFVSGPMWGELGELVKAAYDAGRTIKKNNKGNKVPRTEVNKVFNDIKRRYNEYLWGHQQAGVAKQSKGLRRQRISVRGMDDAAVNEALTTNKLPLGGSLMLRRARLAQFRFDNNIEEEAAGSDNRATAGKGLDRPIVVSQNFRKFLADAAKADDTFKGAVDLVPSVTSHGYINSHAAIALLHRYGAGKDLLTDKLFVKYFGETLKTLKIEKMSYKDLRRVLKEQSEHDAEGKNTTTVKVGKDTKNLDDLREGAIKEYQAVRDYIKKLTPAVTTN